jgi:subtilisin family serine protease
MQSRKLRAFTVVAVCATMVVSPIAGAVRPEAAQTPARVKPAWIPNGVGNPEVTMVLQLTGDPVAVEQANAGRKLDKGEKDAIKGKLKGNQDALRAQIANLGGKVIADYQSAYNGIKVRITRDKLQQLASLPGVVAVRPLPVVRADNTRSVPFIGVPGVWQSLGLHGEGIKIAIIDTGIDYTHANFGGPGTVAAYNTAHANETKPANPAWFGPGAKRVKGGIDLVGDSYDADPESTTYQPVPHPDPNPLDCNDHGSHVAGTAAGSGVLANGSTYNGTYNATTISGNSWKVGPGVAPKADLYAVRVFGCNGSTDVVVDAIEWAVDHDMDVINMSLGSDFGSKDTPDAEAANNAAKAGIVVVISAGNAGANPYIVGSPGTADAAITVAANDPVQTLPAGATLTLGTGPVLQVQVSNGASVGAGTTAYPLQIASDGAGGVGLGCVAGDYAGSTGKIVVTQRGDCDRILRAQLGQAAGAAGVVMINNDLGYPPYEGTIAGVTIPFYGVLAADASKLLAAATSTGTPASATVTNPLYTAFASFSSAGPRSGDSNLKPDITAPGVSISSTQNGSGTEALVLSGTSMAAPHVAGVAALTRQAHPTWKTEDIKSAIVNTGLPSGVVNYKTSRGGTGLVQPAKSIAASVVASTDGKFSVAANFGFAEIDKDFSKDKKITLQNNGSTPAKFNVAQASPGGRPHSVSFDKTTVTVPAKGKVDVKVTLNVPVGTVGGQNGAGLSFREVAGIVQFTPATGSDNAGVTLRVPYYLVPRALSDVSTKIGPMKGNNPSAVATVTNKRGAAIAGDADFYAWGLEDKKDPGKVSNDVRAVGVQSFDNGDGTQFIVFAVNTFDRWSNASTNEFDIFVDVNGDGVDDYVVVGADVGLVTTGSFSGVMGTFVFSMLSDGADYVYNAGAPTDGSVALLALDSPQLCRAGEPCLSAANPRFTYHVESYDLINGGVDKVKGKAKFNAWSSAISQGGFVGGLPPGATDNTTVIAIDSAEWKLTPALGVMVVTLDNKAGEGEAQLIPVDVKK